LPTVTVCGQQAAAGCAAAARFGAVVLFIAPCFEAQGNQSVVEAPTYLYYIQLKASVPSRGVWVPYDDASEKMIGDDFHRLWEHELPRQLVDRNRGLPSSPTGSSARSDLQHGGAAAGQDRRLRRLEESRDGEDLREAQGSERRNPLDTFIDPALVRKVEGIVRDMLREKGFQFADVTHEIADMPAGRS
jgi:hypothetical protein